MIADRLQEGWQLGDLYRAGDPVVGMAMVIWVFRGGGEAELRGLIIFTEELHCA
jgi:hypothetical protein